MNDRFINNLAFVMREIREAAGLPEPEPAIESHEPMTLWGRPEIEVEGWDDGTV